MSGGPREVRYSWFRCPTAQGLERSSDCPLLAFLVDPLAEWVQDSNPQTFFFRGLSCCALQFLEFGIERRILPAPTSTSRPDQRSVIDVRPHPIAVAQQAMVRPHLSLPVPQNSVQFSGRTLPNGDVRTATGEKRAGTYRADNTARNSGVRAVPRDHLGDRQCI